MAQISLPSFFIKAPNTTFQWTSRKRHATELLRYEHSR
jgi:hypothetical protein